MPKRAGTIRCTLRCTPHATREVGTVFLLIQVLLSSHREHTSWDATTWPQPRGAHCQISIPRIRPRYVANALGAPIPVCTFHRHVGRSLRALRLSSPKVLAFEQHHTECAYKRRLALCKNESRRQLLSSRPGGRSDFDNCTQSGVERARCKTKTPLRCLVGPYESKLETPNI